MFAYAASTIAQHPLGNWSLSFARQPEPDLDFEEDLAEDTQQIGGQSPGPAKPPKQKGTSPLLWVLLLALLAGGAYIAMDPDGFMSLISSLTGETSAPVAQAPTRPVPPSPGGAAPAPPPSPAGAPPSVSTPTAPPASVGAMPPKPSPMPSAPTPATTPAPTTPLVQKSTTPLFGEGQRVTITSLGSLTLSQNAAGTTPGPSVKPGSVLVVLDGELQPSGWVYNVRTDAGDQGWVPEQQLRAAP